MSSICKFDIDTIFDEGLTGGLQNKLIFDTFYLCIRNG